MTLKNAIKTLRKNNIPFIVEKQSDSIFSIKVNLSDGKYREYAFYFGKLKFIS